MSKTPDNKDTRTWQEKFLEASVKAYLDLIRYSDDRAEEKSLLVQVRLRDDTDEAIRESIRQIAEDAGPRVRGYLLIKDPEQAYQLVKDYYSSETTYIALGQKYKMPASKVSGIVKTCRELLLYGIRIYMFIDGMQEYPHKVDTLKYMCRQDLKLDSLKSELQEHKADTLKKLSLEYVPELASELKAHADKIPNSFILEDSEPVLPSFFGFSLVALVNEPLVQKMTENLRAHGICYAKQILEMTDEALFDSITPKSTIGTIMPIRNHYYRCIWIIDEALMSRGLIREKASRLPIRVHDLEAASNATKEYMLSDLGIFYLQELAFHKLEVNRLPGSSEIHKEITDLMHKYGIEYMSV